MKIIYNILANSIFILHTCLVVIVLFGWAFPSIWYFYMMILIGTLVSDLIFGYCLLSKWEFDLRKKINPLVTYDFTWSSYYTYKFTRFRVSNKTFNLIALVFLTSSIILNIVIKIF